MTRIDSWKEKPVFAASEREREDIRVGDTCHRQSCFGPRYTSDLCSSSYDFGVIPFGLSGFSYTDIFGVNILSMDLHMDTYA